ncbi:hypothetical protein BJ546DRAFT_984073 [Cryomyces antarcticus]
MREVPELCLSPSTQPARRPVLLFRSYSIRSASASFIARPVSSLSINLSPLVIQHTSSSSWILLYESLDVVDRKRRCHKHVLALSPLPRYPKPADGWTHKGTAARTPRAPSARPAQLACLAATTPALVVLSAMLIGVALVAPVVATGLRSAALECACRRATGDTGGGEEAGWVHVPPVRLWWAVVVLLREMD